MRIVLAAGVSALTLLASCRDRLPTAPQRAEPSLATSLSTALNPTTSHEPSGYSLISDRPFSRMARSATDDAGAEGWSTYEYRYPYAKIAVDSTAPHSAPSVMLVTFPAGMRAGTAAANSMEYLSGQQQIYVSLWMQLSSTWKGSADLALLWIAGSPRVRIGLRPDAAGVPQVRFFLSAPDSRRSLTSNANGASMPIGQWHRLELVMKSNTLGQADGILRAWLDGRSAIDYSDLQLVGRGEAATWQALQLYPSWVGSGTRVPNSMSMSWDHAYVSGSASATPPSVSPPPPTLSEAAVFTEDFESGSLAAFQDGVNPAIHHIVTDPSLVHSGTHALEITYPANGNGGWLTHFMMPGYDSLYVRYWIRFDPNWLGGTKLLDLRGSRIDDQWSSFGKAGVCPNGTDYFSTSVAAATNGNPGDLQFYTYYPGMSRQPDGATCYGQQQGMGTTVYAASRRLTTGVWHEIELWVKLNTPGQSNAEQRMWVDGELKGSWTGLTLRSDSVLRLNSVLIDGSGGSSQTEHVYVDDISVATQLPNGITSPSSPAPVARVALSLVPTTLSIGQTAQATAQLTDAQGATLLGRVITFSSNAPNVATVSPNGSVQAVAAGSATISATSEGVVGSAVLTVAAAAPPPPAPVAAVAVQLNSGSLTVGQSTQATAVLTDASGNALTGRVITWQSANTTLATVSSTGLVTAKAAGTVQIRATSEGITGSAGLTVVAPAPSPVATVTVTLGAGQLTVGQSTQATVVLKDASGNTLTGRTVSWSSSPGTVASVSSSGAVQALAVGTTNITATSEGQTGSATLTVSAAAPPPPAPPPPGASEPQYVAGQNTTLLYEDFETGGGSWMPANAATYSTPPGTGFGGGQAAQFDWPAGTHLSGIDHSIPQSGQGRVVVASWMYRTSAGFLVDETGKKYFEFNNGSSDRITLGLTQGPTNWDLLISGVFGGGALELFAKPNVQPWAPTNVGKYLTNGNWHRVTVRRTQSSSGSLPDGSIEIWVDGVQTHYQTKVPLGTQPVFNIVFSGTWNNNSPQNQTEWIDNVRVWY